MKKMSSMKQMRGADGRDLGPPPDLETNLRRESNKIAEISFLIGGDGFAPNRGQAGALSGSDARRKFYFSLRSGAVLEPQYFVRDVPTLTLNQYKKLQPFLGAQFAA